MNKKWEKEFDEKFLPRKDKDNWWSKSAQGGECMTVGIELARSIKPFITSLLSKQREDILEEIDGKKWEVMGCTDVPVQHERKMVRAHNDDLNDIITHLKKKERINTT